MGFVELGEEFPDVSARLKDLYVSKGEGNSTSVLCTIKRALVDLVARVCRVLEELLRAWMQRDDCSAVSPTIYGHGLESKREKMLG